MIRSLRLFGQRLLVVAIGGFSVWLIVFVVFETADHRLPSILAVAVTYGVAAYVILPRTVRMSVKVLRRRHVPAYTITGDGLPGDPVNLLLIGDLAQLRTAFAAADWSIADRLTLRSSLRIAQAFVFNRPYPTAPFSTLYLFGRGQDIGFQKAIDGSPRKRHHVRFWALGFDHAKASLASRRFWLNTDRPPEDAAVLWVGAGTRDTGFSLTRLTFQITHATNSDTNVERDYIVEELRKSNVIGDVTLIKARQSLHGAKVNHYIADGEVAAASLITRSTTVDGAPGTDVATAADNSAGEEIPAARVTAPD